MMNRRQEKIGMVTSNKMQKTVVVTVDRQFMHPRYKKVIRRSKNFLVHDEKNECRPGDWVRIEETRPLSRQKRWKVAAVISKATQLSSHEEEGAA
jgi:small subunit ribosomal protein S17